MLPYHSDLDRFLDERFGVKDRYSVNM